MVLVQRKADLQCVSVSHSEEQRWFWSNGRLIYGVSVYRTVSTEAVYALAGIPPVEIVVDECKMIYCATYWINRRVEKCCGSGMKKGRSCSGNGRNGSLEASKETGPSVNTQVGGMVRERP